MAATINERPCSSASSLGDGKPEFISKIENQIARINAIYLLQKEDGVITISEDRAIRVLLKRDSGQFWPSIVEFLTSVPLSLYYDEDTLSLLVGMVNGTVYEYTIAADFNSIQQKRHWEAHTMGVTGVVSSNSARMIFSCSKDKTVVWHCADTSVKIAAITSLAWDSKRGQLYSGGADSLVIAWDIAGQKGNCYELNGHDSKISALVLAENPARLFSVDESGHLVCWDLKAKRIMAPGWHDHDRCELCDVPFFWNVKLCWDRKTVGVRRHHCRTCGHSVCVRRHHCRTCGHSVCGNCCNHFTTFPAMGFEKKTRICNTCNTKMQQYPDQFDLTPLAVQCELNKGIATMCLHEDTGKLAAVSFDRSIMLWDVSKLL
uniref:FYVE-type domain-containing protein n=1 Tax=Panagrolaimus sp. ES5 TaxID=591445 RepID=A0AC34F2P7_9BILA